MILLTKDELKARYKISETTLWRLMKNKLITPIYIKGDKRNYYNEEQVQQVLKIEIFNPKYKNHE